MLLKCARTCRLDQFSSRGASPKRVREMNQLLNVVLPVGISFYTFQTMSYTLDIYRGQLQTIDGFLDFALFVSFFPQLVSGPIERARNLLPQIVSERRFDRKQLYEGCWLIYWGLYKKIFVADNLAKFVDEVFGLATDSSGFRILVAAYAFTIQIYCDFSGYTDIARGVAKTLGFELSLNFNVPYAATNPLEFWRRWHITLSQWLRDYLYLPLAGSRPSTGRVLASLMLTMTLGGLWHGARWNFVVWGVYHGLLLVVHGIVRGTAPAPATPPPWRKALAMLGMFHLTCLGMMLFRVQSVGEMSVIGRNLFSSWDYSSAAGADLLYVVLYSSLLLVVQIFQYRTGNLLIVLRWPAALRTALYVAMYLSITLGGSYDGPQFIYFQF